MSTKLDNPDVVWIGLNDFEEEGRFVYASSGTDMKFANWWSNYYPNVGDGRNCVTGDLESTKWENVKCTLKHQFICEILIS